MRPSYRLDHVAIAVADLPATLDLYTRVLGFEQAYRETIVDQGVEAVGLRAGLTTIELLRPLEPDSAISRYLGNAATKLHHTAYQVDDLAAELTRLGAEGIRLIDAAPRRGANGNLVAFLHPKSTGGVLIELCQASEGFSDPPE